MKKVVCITKEWIFGMNVKRIDSPKKGFVYEIESEEISNGILFYYIKGFNEITPFGRVMFRHDGFKPYVNKQEEMNKEMKKVKEEIISKELILN